jgi:glycerol-3-phosphate dehydrogenase (NAD(P)+)
MEKEKKPLVVIAGAGAFGTALGNSLAANVKIKVRLLTIEKEVADSINNTRVNSVYFPNSTLRKRLKATMDLEILKKAEILLLAIPSGVMISYLQKIKPFLDPKTLLVNTAKGLGEGNVIISEYIEENFPNPVVALKGPSFAVELLNLMPTAFTFASRDKAYYEKFNTILKGTNIQMDYSEDIRGVELLSILKNSYAIILGVIDAHYNSANVRFLVLTKVFKELRKVLITFGGNSETIFNFCGYGDFGLTSINDLSRNRTMGLLIGKGFIKDMVSENVVLEGKRSLNIFYQMLQEENMGINPVREFPILVELYKLFHKDYDQRKFVVNVINAGNSDKKSH